MSKLEDINTPEQVAEYLKLNKNTVWKYIREGTMPAVKLGNKYRVNKIDILDFISKNRLYSANHSVVKVKNYIDIKKLDSSIADIVDSIKVNKRKYRQFYLKELVKYGKSLSNLQIKIESGDYQNDDIMQSLNTQTYDIISKGNLIEKNLKSSILREKSKNIFRESILPWFKQSKIFIQTLKSSKFQPLSYHSLDLIYANKPISAGLGYYIDKGLLDNQLSNAIRNRKNM
ncbi:MAG: helix-turn-helix domain-containing protein, partial [bacterium]